ncbi:MAG: hypothetical protein RR424_11015, partial [Oscillospiraceae bacterium]
MEMDMEKLQVIQDMAKNVSAVATDQFADAQTATADFIEYDKLRSMNEQEATATNQQRKETLREKVISMMSLDQVSAQKLAMLGYQEELSAVQAQQAALQTDAERSGLDKVAKDFTGKKRSAAKQKIAKTQKLRRSIMQRQADERLGQDERSYAIAENDTEQLEQGKNSGAMLQRFCNKCLIGSEENRRREFPIRKYVGCNTEEVSIPTENGTLKGVLHKPRSRATGKVVVFFSGNTASTLSQSEIPAKTHLTNGASVLCMDYRGFGKSISTDKQGKPDEKLVEDGMYKDSMAMYNYAKENLAKSPSDIILHGYSLGGSMASRVAAQVSLDNAHKQKDTKVKESERLGGLILQSPINSAYDAARLTISTHEKFRDNKTNWSVNALAKLLEHSSGKFNTEAHMQTVAKYDPNIPVLFLSGSSKMHDDDEDELVEGDFLSLEHTKVD